MREEVKDVINMVNKSLVFIETEDGVLINLDRIIAIDSGRYTLVAVDDNTWRYVSDRKGKERADKIMRALIATVEDSLRQGWQEVVTFDKVKASAGVD